METQQLVVERIEKIESDAVIIFLAPIGQAELQYEAGQFLTFTFKKPGGEVRRSYSIVTTPGLDTHLAIIVKRHINGDISRRLADHLQAGDILNAFKPAGRFTIDTEPGQQRQVFFIAAGSGISPVFPLLKKVLHDEPLSEIVLIYQNHDEASIIFRKELEILQQHYTTRFNWINLLSNPLEKGVYPRRLNNYLLEQLLRQMRHPGLSSIFYLCGPPAFMRMAQFVLKTSGVPDESIRKENFVADLLHHPPLIEDQSPKQVELRYKGKVFRFTSTYPMNILQAALQEGIQLPYSCRGGRCSSCTAICVSGTVKMAINEVLTEKELQQGLVLTCVGYAESDVVLEL